MSDKIKKVDLTDSFTPNKDVYMEASDVIPSGYTLLETVIDGNPAIHLLYKDSVFYLYIKHRDKTYGELRKINTFDWYHIAQELSQANGRTDTPLDDGETDAINHENALRRYDNLGRDLTRPQSVSNEPLSVTPLNNQTFQSMTFEEYEQVRSTLLSRREASFAAGRRTGGVRSYVAPGTLTAEEVGRAYIASIGTEDIYEPLF